MAWSAKFFRQRRLTSKLKHIVLRSYVKEFAYHLGSVRPAVYYVDGFAGAGMYESGDESEDGSPLLIAKLAQQIKTSTHPFDLKCLNVESNLKRFRSLNEATEPFRPDIVEKNYHASFADVITEILQRIGNAPTFFFIDPFGTKGIPFTSLLPIFNRRSITEVLITLHTDGIAKKAGWFKREKSPSMRDREYAHKVTSHLAAALGVSLEKLRTVWSETAMLGDTAGFEKRVIAYYLLRLKSKTRFAFTKAFKVLYHRSDSFAEPPVCFHLVFATQHQQGLFKMNDAMVEALATFYGEVYGNTMFPTFEAARKQQEDPMAIREEIQAAFSSKPFTVDELKCHCMQQTEYLLKSAEYTKLVRQMYHSGELKKLDPGTASNAKTRYQIAQS